MDVVKLLAELKAYKAGLDEAIAALERLAGDRGGAGKAKRAFSEATRKKMAQAQRKRWAKKHVKSG